MNKKRKYFASNIPLNAHEISKSPSAFLLDDSSKLNIHAEFLLKTISRDNTSQIAKLSKQFIKLNQDILNYFHVNASTSYDGNYFNIVMHSKTTIGALPLLSPTTFKPDYSLIISPRFGWSGIGSVLGQTGWKILPKILDLPALNISEKNIPPWVLSSIILWRIKAMLSDLDKKFEIQTRDLSSPKGSVDWNKYASNRITNGKFTEVPCTFPELNYNSELKSAIHYALIKQLQSLSTQRKNGFYVLQLIEICLTLIDKVKKYLPIKPNQLFYHRYLKNPLKSEIFRKGITAIEWTTADKGLAGIGDLNGLPWMMSMELFYEAWLETVVEKLSTIIGGIIKTGRKRETITPLSWDPPFLGSQKFILPDIILVKDSWTIIFDAKYKDHWEELNFSSWQYLEAEIKERHRNDILQILAYSSLSNSSNIICCLVYPCKLSTWTSLQKRNRAYHNASITIDDRKIRLILTAIPMEITTEKAAEFLKSFLLNSE